MRSDGAIIVKIGDKRLFDFSLFDHQSYLFPDSGVLDMSQCLFELVIEIARVEGEVWSDYAIHLC